MRSKLEWKKWSRGFEVRYLIIVEVINDVLVNLIWVFPWLIQLNTPESEGQMLEYLLAGPKWILVHYALYSRLVKVVCFGFLAFACARSGLHDLGNLLTQFHGWCAQFFGAMQISYSRVCSRNFEFLLSSSANARLGVKEGTPHSL